MNRFCLCDLGLLMRHNCALALSAAKRFSGHKQERNFPSHRIADTLAKSA